jgi:hypothetical protein
MGCILISLFLSITPLLQAQFNQIGTDLLGENDADFFGSAVSLSADGYTLAVGAPEHDQGGSNYGITGDAGRVSIYTWNGSNWVQKGAHIDGLNKEDLFGAQVCLSDDGNVIAIRNGDAVLPSPGGLYVHVYAWNGSSWVQRGLDIRGMGTIKSMSMSADGDKLVLGTPNADVFKNGMSMLDAGRVEVVHWDGLSWVRQGSLVNGQFSGEFFGYSVSLSADGNTFIVGAPTDHGFAVPNTRVYHWNGSGWTQKGTTIYGDGGYCDTGAKVSLSADGNTFAVGAPNEGLNGLTEMGRIRIYNWDGSDWVQKGNDIFGEADDDLLGGKPISLSSDGNKLAISRPYNYIDTTVNTGYVRMYHWDAPNSIWVRKSNDILGQHRGDYTGSGLALSADANIIAVGANYHLRNGRVQVLRNQGISGALFQDFNTNCSQEDNEYGIPNRNLTINPGNIQLQTNDYGFWSLNFLPVGNYTLTVDTTNGWLTTCPNPITFSITNSEDLLEIPAIGMLSKFPCSAPHVSIHAPFLRPGFSNQFIYVRAVNRHVSSQILDSAYVILNLPPLLTVNTASLPYTTLGNNQYKVYVADSLYPGESVSFRLSCTLSTNAILGQSLCMSAQLYPVKPCVQDDIPSNNVAIPCSSLYDNSHLVIHSDCLNNDSIFFGITNTGTGNMSCSSQVRLFIDGQIAKIDTIQLSSAQTITFRFKADGHTWRMETDQHPLHPSSSIPSQTVEQCDGSYNSTPNLVNLFPQDDNAPFIDIYCGEVRGSYDPNDKTGFPLGIGETHDILPNQKLEYLIRFQNTGTDTTFTIIIRDTLTADFNMFSVKSGVSSHDYSFKLYGPRILEWTFSNVMLPDSNVNEAKSHGFVKFEVDLKPNLPEGHRIENTAFIYFDFNAPIITNTYFHTINSNIYNFSSPVNAYSPNPLLVNTFPNPVKDYLYINLNNNKFVNLRILDNSGKVVYKKTIHNPIESINLSNLSTGIYYCHMDNGKQYVTQKIVKL